MAGRSAARGLHGQKQCRPGLVAAIEGFFDAAERTVVLPADEYHRSKRRNREVLGLVIRYACCSWRNISAGWRPYTENPTETAPLDP